MQSYKAAAQPWSGVLQPCASPLRPVTPRQSRHAERQSKPAKPQSRDAKRHSKPAANQTRNAALQTDKAAKQTCDASFARRRRSLNDFHTVTCVPIPNLSEVRLPPLHTRHRAYPPIRAHAEWVGQFRPNCRGSTGYRHVTFGKSDPPPGFASPFYRASDAAVIGFFRPDPVAFSVSRITSESRTPKAQAMRQRFTKVGISSPRNHDSLDLPMVAVRLRGRQPWAP